MKRIAAAVLCLCTMLCLLSCGRAGTPFSIAESKLKESGMSKTELSSSEIASFEKRFSSMGLEKGFSKVCSFRSQTQYAYLIEFESEGDAAIFYATLAASKYDTAQSGNTVVYGKSPKIAEIPFDR